jgi:NitT/TauT family transport system substrate-binding protein
MRKQAFFLALSLVVAAILFSLPSVKAAELVKLHYVPGLYGAPLFIAADKGFFDQAGIKVDMKPTTAVTEVVPFLSTGQIDVAAGGYGAGIFSAINDGINIRIVAPMAITPKDRVPSGLMVRKNSGIKSVEELKGKKVACAGGLVGGSGFQLIEILEGHGLSGNDVIINNLRFPDQVVALSQGAVDAAMASEPYVTKMKQENIATLLEGSPPGTAVTGVVYSLKFMKERPQVAKNFMVALMKGFREIQGDKFFAQEHLEIFHKYTKVAPEVVKQIITFDWDPNMDIGTKTLLKQQATYMKYGSLKYKTPLKPEQFVDETYVKHALSVLGLYKER